MRRLFRKLSFHACCRRSAKAFVLGSLVMGTAACSSLHVKQVDNWGQDLKSREALHEASGATRAIYIDSREIVKLMPEEERDLTPDENKKIQKTFLELVDHFGRAQNFSENEIGHARSFLKGFNCHPKTIGACTARAYNIEPGSIGVIMIENPDERYQPQDFEKEFAQDQTMIDGIDRALDHDFAKKVRWAVLAHENGHLGDVYWDSKKYAIATEAMEKDEEALVSSKAECYADEKLEKAFMRVHNDPGFLREWAHMRAIASVFPVVAFGDIPVHITENVLDRLIEKSDPKGEVIPVIDREKVIETLKGVRRTTIGHMVERYTKDSVDESWLELANQADKSSHYKDYMKTSVFLAECLKKNMYKTTDEKEMVKRSLKGFCYFQTKLKQALGRQIVDADCSLPDKKKAKTDLDVILSWEKEMEKRGYGVAQKRTVKFQKIVQL